MTDSLRVSRGRVLAALIADTFQEARARWLFWGLFALSTLLILLFLFVLKIDLVEGAVSLFGVESTTRMVDVHRFVIASYSWVSVILYIWALSWPSLRLQVSFRVFWSRAESRFCYRSPSRARCYCWDGTSETCSLSERTMLI